MKKSLTVNQKNLVRRYLLWCYKTTKEDLDRIDRYFTQAIVDKRLLEILKKNKIEDPACQKKIDDFSIYLRTKETNALAKKLVSPQKNILQPEYWYLQKRCTAIEQAISEFLGKKELKAIQSAYEAEMSRRILESREHT